MTNKGNCPHCAGVMQQTVDQLLLLVQPFCKARRISESRLSKLMFNDGKRIGLMRSRNGDIGSRSLLKAFDWMAAHWPANAEWPAEVLLPISPDPDKHPLVEERAA